MVDLEMPKDSAGFSNKTFIVKLHVKIGSGEILIAESKNRSISDAMKNITSEIENQTDSTDRQKHTDSTRKHG
jgi:ribosome-associated translation inhibitor RaiA